MSPDAFYVQLFLVVELTNADREIYVILTSYETPTVPKQSCFQVIETHFICELATQWAGARWLHQQQYNLSSAIIFWFYVALFEPAFIEILRNKEINSKCRVSYAFRFSNIQ